ncbi:MAG: hypothetical protein H0U86_17460 [Chloroflexi bacterium]|nr:hypothetical protein [Chloroflexota bacterium]
MNDLLWLSIATLAAYSVALRSSSGDGWTRQIGLKIRATHGEWAAIDNDVAKMLRFLTGDEWSIKFTRRRPRVLNLPAADADAVCLLSGGLDSLVGAIDLMAKEDGRRVLLVGVEASSIRLVAKRISAISCKDAFPDRVLMRQTWATFRRPTATQARPLPTRPDANERLVLCRSSS